MKMHNHVYDDNKIINSNADDDLIVGPHNFPLTGIQFKDCDGMHGGVEEGNQGWKESGVENSMRNAHLRLRKSLKLGATLLTMNRNHKRGMLNNRK